LSEPGLVEAGTGRDQILITLWRADYVLAQWLVFKGGTALRLCYVKDFRYSADLDFSILDGSTEEGLKTVRGALQDVAGTISQLGLTDDDPPRISYVGPLGRERTLKLDIADDEYVVNTEHRSLLLRWPDLPEAARVHVYTPLEIAAEKLRCVLQRLQCRDLFDLSTLFNEAGVEAKEAAALFERKAKHRGFDPKSFATRYKERVTQYEKRWEAELGEHLPQTVPHFGDIERRVARHLRRARML